MQITTQKSDHPATHYTVFADSKSIGTVQQVGKRWTFYCEGKKDWATQGYMAPSRKDAIWCLIANQFGRETARSIWKLDR